jgi:arylsulfatase A-like enzyme
LFLRWPGHVAGGSRDGRITGTVDIAPTVLDVAGVGPDPAQPPLDGRSLLSGVRRTRIVLEYWRETWIPTWASLRTRRYQYVEYYREGRRFFREYYNLVRDPWQLRNLLHDGNPANNPDLARLSTQLRRHRGCAGTTGVNACP